MKIVLYTLNYYPELIGIGKYNTEMCEWLSKNGHNIVVVAANPYYPEWTVRKGYRKIWYKIDIINNIKVYRCPIFVKKNISSLFRIFHLVSFCITSFPILLFICLDWKPHLFIQIEPPFLCAPNTLLLSKIFKTKTWLHIQDFEIDAGFDTKLFTNKKLKDEIKRIEKYILNKFNRISTISNNMIKHVETLIRDNEKIVYLPNWADSKTIAPGQPDLEIKKELGIHPDDIIVLYSGNFGHKQAIENIVDVANIIQKKDDSIQFVLCGEGAKRQKIERLSAHLGNVHLLPVQTLDRYIKFLNTADIHIITQRTDINDSVLPSKITNILSCGGALIATANKNTAVEKVVKDSGGIVCTPGNIEKIAYEIIELSANNKIRNKMKEKARKYALKFLDKKEILKNLNKQLEDSSN